MTAQQAMTRRSVSVRQSLPAEGSPGREPGRSPGREPGRSPGREPELPTVQCTRCGALGTHYLTCPGLRLPAGYRLSAESRPQPSRQADSCLLCG
jgi:hypothetical protein